MANTIFKRNLEVLANKNSREAVPLSDFVIVWTDSLTNYTTLTGAFSINGQQTIGKPIPALYSLVYFGAILGLMASVFVSFILNKKTEWKLLFVISATLLTTLFITNYSFYAKYHYALTIQSRYLLTITPIIIVMSAVAINHFLRKTRPVKLLSLIILLLLFTQGGGIITHVYRSSDDWYWHNSKIVEINHVVKKLISPIIRQ